MANEHNTVKRWVLLINSKETSGRKLFYPKQGRYTFATQAGAEAVVAEFKEPTVFAANKKKGFDYSSLHAEEVDCYAGHFDPVRTYYPLKAS